MKKITLLLFTFAASLSVSAQITFHTESKLQDTLVVYPGSFRFIKIDRKVYRIVSTLEEVPEEPKLLFQYPTWQNTYPLNNLKLAPAVFDSISTGRFLLNNNSIN